VLKFCASTLCKLILKLFNLSISSSVFPTIWKDSFIIPLHKKGAKADAQNYRGFSKLYIAFQRIITSHLQHLCSSLISPCQHGFVKGRSTITNLLELSSIVIGGFKKIMQTDVIRGQSDKYLASPPDGVTIAREIYFRVVHSRRRLLSKFQPNLRKNFESVLF